jgi:hypothetical protein
VKFNEKETTLNMNEDPLTDEIESFIDTENGLIPYNSPVRNIILAIVLCAVRQLFESPVMDINFTISNYKKLGKNPNIKDIKYKTNIKLRNDPNYEMALYWFLNDNKDNVFSFMMCCYILGINQTRAMERIKWIRDKKSELMRNEEKSINIKDISYSKTKVQEKLKVKYARFHEISDHVFKLSIKTPDFCKKFERIYKSEFGFNFFTKAETRSVNKSKLKLLSSV